MWQKLKEGFEERVGLQSLIKTKLRDYRVPQGINIFYTLGIVTLIAYLVQAVSGYFLLIYYIPHPDHAFKSVNDMMNVVPFGWLPRMIHIVVSNLMVVVIILHLISIFVMLSYKKPRELTWVAGVCLFFVTLVFCLSGYLLPWSQRSFWATTIVTNIPTAFPVIGDYVANTLRGGENVSGITLTRFFSLHVGFLPPLFLALVGFHVYLVRSLGLSTPPFSTSEPGTSSGQPFYPYLFLKQVFMVMLFFVVVFFMITFLPTLFLPEAANTPADPLKTPLRIKPEWYFLAPYQLFKIIPNKFFGITLQVLLAVIFMTWPYLDTKEEKNILRRPLLILFLVIVLAAWAALTIWGRYS